MNVIPRNYSSLVPFSNFQSASYSPTEIAKIYKFPNFTGKGMTVGVIELGGGVNTAVLQRFWRFTNIPDTPKVTSIELVPQTPDNRNASGECYLDIEILGSLASQAEQKVIFVPGTVEGFIQGIERCLEEKVDAISISWGFPEVRAPKADLAPFEAVLQKCKEQHIPVFVASGDKGSYDGVYDHFCHVDYPASSPFVLGCGGVAIYRTATGYTEKAWFDGEHAASGGGVSAYWLKPAFQNNIKTPSLKLANGTTVPPNVNRGVPDVAGLADQETGYIILTEDGFMVEGGTSAVAPMWAALYVCLKEAEPEICAKLDFSTFLYANIQAMWDVSTGHNENYKASKGWDPITGLGAPHGGLLLQALKDYG